MLVNSFVQAIILRGSPFGYVNHNVPLVGTAGYLVSLYNTDSLRY